MKTSEIAELVGGELRGSGDIDIESVADFPTAETAQLAFYEKAGPLPPTNASCVLCKSPTVDDGSAARPEAETQAAAGVSLIVVADPKLAFAKAALRLIPWDNRQGYDETSVIPPQNTGGTDVRAAFIGPHVSIGEGTYLGECSIIHAGVRIGRNVTIKKHSVIHPNCVIYDNVEIGFSCVIHAGSVIGADGFGYVRDGESGYIKFPQIGRVVIEDSVEIGANTCIDRGALGETRIGEGTKIDNLVQVGHNVNIGKRCVIAAQTGISGSVTIEDDCVIGGQVGFGDHVRVQSGAVIGSQAGILPGKIVRPGVWWGTPIQPLEDYKRQNAHVKGLARLKDEMKALKAKIRELSKKNNS